MKEDQPNKKRLGRSTVANTISLLPSAAARPQWIGIVRAVETPAHCCSSQEAQRELLSQHMDNVKSQLCKNVIAKDDSKK